MMFERVTLACFIHVLSYVLVAMYVCCRCGLVRSHIESTLLVCDSARTLPCMSSGTDCISIITPVLRPHPCSGL
jgi:hypothetical protein